MSTTWKGKEIKLLFPVFIKENTMTCTAYKLQDKILSLTKLGRRNGLPSNP
jgi:hypothetical protein